MEKQNSQIRQHILKKKKTEKLTLPNFKTYYKNYRSNQILVKHKHIYNKTESWTVQYLNSHYFFKKIPRYSTIKNSPLKQLKIHVWKSIV